MPNFSNFTIHVDESGDHGLERINPEYPLLVLAFCLTAKEDYRTAIVPEIVGFKHRWFGHEAVILHAHDIRKEKGDFAFLFDRVIRQSFLADLTDLMERLPYTLVVSAIDKLKLKNHYKAPENPYSIAMQFCLERANLFLREQSEADRLTHVLVESRGPKEDADLELAFRRICDGTNACGCRLPFQWCSWTRNRIWPVCNWPTWSVIPSVAICSSRIRRTVPMRWSSGSFGATGLAGSKAMD